MHQPMGHSLNGGVERFTELEFTCRQATAVSSQQEARATNENKAAGKETWT